MCMPPQTLLQACNIISMAFLSLKCPKDKLIYPGQTVSDATLLNSTMKQWPAKLLYTFYIKLLELMILGNSNVSTKVIFKPKRLAKQNSVPIPQWTTESAIYTICTMPTSTFGYISRNPSESRDDLAASHHEYCNHVII